MDKKIKKRSSISVIVPARDEENNLAPTLEKLIPRLGEYWEDWEILIYDDASRDRTGEIAESYAKNYDKIKVFHSAMAISLGGIFAESRKLARGDYYIIVHGQNDITEDSLRKIFTPQGYDLIIPYQENWSERPLIRIILSKLFVAILNFSFNSSLQYYNHYVLYRREILRGLVIDTTGYAFQAEILLKLLKTKSVRYLEIPVHDDFTHKRKSRALTKKNIFSVSCFYWKMLLDKSWRHNEKERRHGIF